MSLKTTKKYLQLAFILISLFISIRVNAQYPVYLYDSNPFIKFWVTTDPFNDEYPTTLRVKDEDLVKILENIASTTENLYAETLRNNYWMMYNEETRNEKEQSLSKYKALKLQNVIEENILSWVNEGFNVTKDGGKPAYIEDEVLFFQTIEQKITENFKNYLERYYKAAPEDEKNYLKKISKILTSKNNTEALSTKDYYLQNNEENLSDEKVEGWDNWLGVSTNQFTNPMIAFLDAKDGLDSLIANEKAKYAEEITNGKGFLSFKRCTIKYYEIDSDTSDFVGPARPPTEGETFFGDPYYYNDIWKGAEEGTYPKVSCTTIIPGYLIAEQVSEIYRSKYNFIKQTAISTNGDDLVLDSIEENLKNFQKNIFEIGVIGRDSSTKKDTLYSDLNDAIEKASEELKKRDGGNTEISKDIDDPRNTSSRFYPKNFLTDEKWKEVWDFKQSSNNNWYSWFDFLYDWQNDNWIWNKK
jgi:hypothetical protein